MDQNQDQIDSEVAQEVISLLNRKVMSLRAENAQLQSRLSESAKSEGDACEVPNGDTLHLLEEIEYWKGEVERKPDPKEVAALERRLEKSKRRKRESAKNLRSQVEQLQAELAEALSARQKEQIAREALEKRLDTMERDFDRINREMRESLARVGSHQSPCATAGDKRKHRHNRGHRGGGSRGINKKPRSDNNRVGAPAPHQANQA